MHSAGAMMWRPLPYKLFMYGRGQLIDPSTAAIIAELPNAEWRISQFPIGTGQREGNRNQLSQGR